MSRFDFLIFIGNLDETKKKTESTSTVSALKLTFILAQFHIYIFLSNWAKDEI